MRRDRFPARPLLGAAALALAIPSCATAAPFAWSGAETTAADAARLFETVCLDTGPDFLAAGPTLDALGFVPVPKSLTRIHPERGIAAVVVPAGDVEAQDVRSCAILVEGLPPQAAQAAVEPLVPAHLAAASRSQAAAGLSHVVWSSPMPQGEVRVTASQTGGAAYLGVLVDPRPSDSEGG